MQKNECGNSAFKDERKTVSVYKDEWKPEEGIIVSEFETNINNSKYWIVYCGCW